MVTLEFWARMTSDQTLIVPAEIAAQIRDEHAVRVVVIVPEASDEQAWSRLTADQFLRGSDAVYGDVSTR